MGDIMKWIYNNYEFDNRINNLAWTICGDYSYDIDVLEMDYSSKEVSLYFGIIAGARRKYVDWNIVKKYLIHRISKGYEKDIILDLVQIVLNNLVESKVIEDRPGIEEIRAKAYRDIINRFAKIYNDNILQNIKYTLILEGMGKHPSVDGLSRRLINEIKNINLNNEIIEILKDVDSIYIKYFNTIANDLDKNERSDSKEYKEIDIDFDTFSDFMYEELYSDEYEAFIENEIDSISSSMLVESVGEIKLSDSRNTSNRVIYVDEETASKIYEKIEYYYGKSYLNKNEIKKVETKNCRNIHEGCRVHFTEGVLRSECKNVFQVKYVTRHKENNLKKYREKIKIYKRNINKLTENISRILIEESINDRVYSDCGTIDQIEHGELEEVVIIKYFIKI